MKRNKYLIKRLDKHLVYLLATILFISCADFDQKSEDERYLTTSHFDKIAESGSTVSIKSIDGAILSYFRDGDDSRDNQFGLKAVQLGMDLRSNDMDMSVNTWFGAYSNYDNVILTSLDNDFLWKFFYKIIKDSNEVINLIPDNSNEELLVYKHKAYCYRGIAYFYLLRIYQHTKADDSTLAIPIDLGELVPKPKSTVGVVKSQIINDLTLAYNGLETYTRTTTEEVDRNVAAAFLARYHLTYENWEEAETYADIAMQVGSISDDILHGFDELSLSETLWGAEVTNTTSGVYASFFSHISQINDGYSGWDHFKTANSNLYDLIPATDKRKKWFADQEYAPETILVPDTWGHYNITPKYTSLKFIAQPGPGEFIGDYIYLRNTEFYLTKSEALARQNKNTEAQQVLFDLNSIRDDSYVKSTKIGQDLIDEILIYRRIELWGDGVASFDMARLGIGLNRQDGRMNLVIPGGDLIIPPLDKKMIFEIPQRELDGNPNID